MTKKRTFFSVKSDFKSDVLKNSNRLPKTTKRGNGYGYCRCRKERKKEEKVTTVISSLLRVKSEE